MYRPTMTKTLSLVRPSLLKLPFGCKELSAPTLSLPSKVRVYLEEPPQKREQDIRFALTHNALYASLGNQVHVQAYTSDERFRILIMGRAKGPGFVEIGPEWGRGLVEFGDGFSFEGLDQARVLAGQLQELLGYKVVEKDYGADF